MSNAATLELAQLADDLSAASGRSITNAAAALVAQGAQVVTQQAQLYAPRRTGALASSIHATFTDPLHARVGPSVFYAPFQEYGTGPHVIRPRNAGGVLVFTVNGKKVVARVVHHPGNPAHPFMRPAAHDAANALARGLGESGAQLIVQGG